MGLQFCLLERQIRMRVRAGNNPLHAFVRRLTWIKGAVRAIARHEQVEGNALLLSGGACRRPDERLAFASGSLELAG